MCSVSDALLTLHSQHTSHRQNEFVSCNGEFDFLSFAKDINVYISEGYQSLEALTVAYLCLGFKKNANLIIRIGQCCLNLYSETVCKDLYYFLCKGVSHEFL